jgi:hypothetical protein
LLNTSCSIVIFDELYPGHEKSQAAWEKVNRLWMPFSDIPEKGYTVDFYKDNPLI